MTDKINMTLALSYSLRWVNILIITTIFTCALQCWKIVLINLKYLQMIHLPIVRHGRRFLASMVIFGSTVLLMLWLPIKIVHTLWPSFMPYHITLSRLVFKIICESYKLTTFQNIFIVFIHFLVFRKNSVFNEILLHNE